eukprot:tig00000498_g1658.t1
MQRTQKRQRRDSAKKGATDSRAALEVPSELELPDELVASIIALLPAPERLSASLVNRQFSRAVHSNAVWRELTLDVRLGARGRACSLAVGPVDVEDADDGSEEGPRDAQQQSAGAPIRPPTASAAVSFLRRPQLQRVEVLDLRIRLARREFEGSLARDLFEAIPASTRRVGLRFGSGGDAAAVLCEAAGRVGGDLLPRLASLALRPVTPAAFEALLRLPAVGGCPAEELALEGWERACSADAGELGALRAGFPRLRRASALAPRDSAALSAVAAASLRVDRLIFEGFAFSPPDAALLRRCIDAGTRAVELRGCEGLGRLGAGPLAGLRSLLLAGAPEASPADDRAALAWLAGAGARDVEEAELEIGQGLLDSQGRSPPAALLAALAALPRLAPGAASCGPSGAPAPPQEEAAAAAGAVLAACPALRRFGLLGAGPVHLGGAAAAISRAAAAR